MCGSVSTWIVLSQIAHCSFALVTMLGFFLTLTATFSSSTIIFLIVNCQKKKCKNSAADSLSDLNQTRNPNVNAWLKCAAIARNIASWWIRTLTSTHTVTSLPPLQMIAHHIYESGTLFSYTFLPCLSLWPSAWKILHHHAPYLLHLVPGGCQSIHIQPIKFFYFCPTFVLIDDTEENSFPTFLNGQ